MLFPPVDPNEQFRARRAAVRRRKRLRRAAVIGVLLVSVVFLAGGAQLVGGSGSGGDAKPNMLEAEAFVASGPSERRPLPLEVRGVHVTLGLASLPGKLEEYLALEEDGLTALELDVKEENGQVGFTPSSVPLARQIGAAREFYAPREAARMAHERSIYLVGRIVTFEDPILATSRPDLAIRRAGGSVWRDGAGLAWANPYDRRVWKYNVDLAVAAARAGFDEILFDYVRFPSDGDVASAVYRNRGGLKKHEVVPAFLRYASRRLEPLGVRVSAAVFGLSAARDLGIGQVPRKMSPYLDAVYAMTYPSLFGPGELGVSDPGAMPGAMVTEALRHFRKALRGRDALLVTWVQDWSFEVDYGIDQVRAQIQAARLAGAKGFMLWNAEGVYTDGALAAP